MNMSLYENQNKIKDVARHPWGLGGGGGLPYVGYMGMHLPNGYGFSAVSVSGYRFWPFWS